jgi:hypothetical protein
MVSHPTEKTSLLPCLPPDPRAPEEIRLTRRARNQRNTFVKLLSLYPYMQAVVLNLDMQRLKAIAYSCNQLRGEFKFEDASSYKLWANTVTAIRIVVKGALQL